MGRTIAAVREQACDDLCVHVLGGAEGYRETLLEVASHLARRPDPSLGLAMTRSSKLGRRLSWIDRTRGASRCVSRVPVRMALIISAAAAVGLLGALEFARSAVRASEEPARPNPLGIQVVVRAKDVGRPLAGASVRVANDWKETLLRTNAEGKAYIDLSQRKFRMSPLGMDVWADGYVQQRFSYPTDGPRRVETPGTVEVELLPGEETLGGTVVDEQGRPIAGVKVVV